MVKVCVIFYFTLYTNLTAFLSSIFYFLLILHLLYNFCRLFAGVNILHSIIIINFSNLQFSQQYFFSHIVYFLSFSSPHTHAHHLFICFMPSHIQWNYTYISQPLKTTLLCIPLYAITIFYTHHLPTLLSFTIWSLNTFFYFRPTFT